MDRVVSVFDGTGTTRFTYNDNGTRKSVIYPDGSNETYEYDENNLNIALVNRKADGTLIEAYSYTYDAANHQTSKTDAKGTTTFTYDKVGRISTITEPNSTKTVYAYDKAGNRLTEWKYVSGTLIEETKYKYDTTNHLLSTETKSQVAGSSNQVSYTYDANGNMLSKKTSVIKPFESGNQPIFILEKIGVNPNTLTQYTYDYFNQLKTSDDGTHKISYKYNGMGYRVEKTVVKESNEAPVTNTTRYLYEVDKVVLEVDGTNQEIAKNTYGTNLLSREMADATVYYMYNGHGDVTTLLSDNGDLVASYYYDIWGNIIDKTESEMVSNPYRYAGYQYDEETDLYYLNARYYDAKIARFLTEDTYKGRQNDPLSLNLYTYCHNEPVMYRDPSGHKEDNDRYIDTKTEAGAKAMAILNAATEEWGRLNSEMSKYTKGSKKYNEIKGQRDLQHEIAENARAEYAVNSGNIVYYQNKYNPVVAKKTNDTISTNKSNQIDDSTNSNQNNMYILEGVDFSRSPDLYNQLVGRYNNEMPWSKSQLKVSIIEMSDDELVQHYLDFSPSLLG
ncbi:MAG: RHS repeat-associated core domain-containing protein, partial [Prevotella sp.]|nr:RHS repeat-associated core domain-containing protein [Prevotella sp.]